MEEPQEGGKSTEHSEAGWGITKFDLDFQGFDIEESTAYEKQHHWAKKERENYEESDWSLVRLELSMIDCCERTEIVQEEKSRKEWGDEKVKEIECTIVGEDGSVGSEWLGREGSRDKEMEEKSPIESV